MDLPFELEVHILERIPDFLSLQRAFKVCKTWNTIIGDGILRKKYESLVVGLISKPILLGCPAYIPQIMYLANMQYRCSLLVNQVPHGIQTACVYDYAGTTIFTEVEYHFGKLIKLTIKQPGKAKPPNNRSKPFTRLIATLQPYLKLYIYNDHGQAVALITPHSVILYAKFRYDGQIYKPFHVLAQSPKYQTMVSLLLAKVGLSPGWKKRINAATTYASC